MNFRKFILTNGMHLSWAIALVATLGSLYYSELAGFIPCTYCWYQRIAMYPLVLILGIAAAFKHWSQTLYAIPMAAIGLGISVFHYLVQKTTIFAGVGSSCGIIPCNGIYVNYYGFVTIPFMAGIAFLLILILQVALLIASRK